MHEYEEQGQSHRCARGGRVRDAPCYACEEHEEGEEVGEGGVGAVPGVFRFCGGEGGFVRGVSGWEARRVCEGKAYVSKVGMMLLVGQPCFFGVGGGQGRW